MRGIITPVGEFLDSQPNGIEFEAHHDQFNRLLNLTFDEGLARGYIAINYWLGYMRIQFETINHCQLETCKNIFVRNNYTKVTFYYREKEVTYNRDEMFELDMISIIRNCR